MYFSGITKKNYRITHKSTSEYTNILCQTNFVNLFFVKICSLIKLQIQDEYIIFQNLPYVIFGGINVFD